MAGVIRKLAIGAVAVALAAAATPVSADHDTQEWSPNQLIVRADEAWHELAFRGEGVRIAIIDSGIHAAHPDFNGQVDETTSTSCVGGGFDDVDSHGTAVAGAAAGYWGTADAATLVAVRVVETYANGPAAASDIVCGLEYIISLNQNADPSDDIDVANISSSDFYGTCTDQPALCTAVVNALNAGIVIVEAGGQDKTDVAEDLICGADPRVICVSGLRSARKMWKRSNFGTRIDIAAPSVNVWVPDVAGGAGPGGTGTSYAAPQVAGAAAVVLGVDGSLSPQEVRDLVVRGGACPSGATNGTAGPCPQGSGRWRGDRDRTTEPRLDVLGAAQLA